MHTNISYVILSILSIINIFFISYSIYHEKLKISILIIFLNRLLLSFYIFISIYSIISYIDYKNNVLFIISNIFFDLSVYHIFIGLEFLSFHTYKNAQMSLRLKVNKNESSILKTFFTLILVIILLCIIFKNVLCPYYNTTHYLVYFYAMFSLGLTFNLLVCWYFFIQLNTAIAQIQITLISENASSTADSNPLIAFKRFLILMTIILCISLGYTAYICISNVQNVTHYFDQDKYYIPYNAFMSMFAAMSVTFFFWQSPAESTDKADHDTIETNKNKLVTSMSPSYRVIINLSNSTPSNVSL